MKLFWDKVRIGRTPDECWEWTAYKDKHGYGKFSSGPHHGLHCLAHRSAWQLLNGPVPGGLDVLHKCDNRSCCNPNHLFVGTHQENMSDMKQKGRSVGFAGETNPSAILTEKEVQKIRKSKKSGKQLSEEYRVACSTISAIKNHKLWRHLK